MPPEISPKAKTLATTGVILGVFLAAIESTAIATAMPTATTALGGIALIHYVFAAYSLATVSTITVWGRLIDIWGVRISYLIGCSIFLAGSALCGISQNVYHLIFFRLIQGMGAGAIFPIAMTTLSSIHTEFKRAKMQVYVSMVWAIASVIGPPVGAYVTQHLSWRWVFYLNLPAGLISIGLVESGLHSYLQGDDVQRRSFDRKGSALLVGAILALLAAIAVNKSGGLVVGIKGMLGLAALTAVLLVLFFRHIATSPNPFIPGHIVKNPFFIRAGASNFFMCMAMFGSFAFVPLFCQAGLGQSVAEAGHTLTLSMLGWVTSSSFAAQAYLRYPLKTLGRIGIFVMFLSFAYLAWRLTTITIWPFRLSMFTMGMGMGICFAPTLLGLQSVLARRDLGTGTATFQLLRNLGGLIGVTVMGTLLAMHWDRSVPLAGASTLASQSLVRQAMSKVFMTDAFITLAGLWSIWNLPHTPRPKDDTVILAAKV
ncbi:MAG: MFS transporter [Elusimicrobia bacterium]|nr:MFS transporter [Elusimicrobiota bacterium]